MRAKGITYDTGFCYRGGSSRTHFDPAVVRRELEIIRDDLHCTAVRLTGGDPERLEHAATHAADLGLEVWFSPYPLDLTADAMLALFADCATRAERVRARGAEVVFVAGAELSLMNPGFLPGDTEQERVAALFDKERLPELARVASTRLDGFFAAAVPMIRERFAGRITYASVPLERIDWTPFDIVSMDLYRSAEVADRFADGVRAFAAQDKPVAITEFGTTAYRGAGERGARVMEIATLDPVTSAPVRLDGVYVRDEPGQARYLCELLEVFDAAGVDSAFVFLFALEDFPHRPDGDPRDDLDLASPGIVRVLEHDTGTAYPGLRWEPKAAFTALGAYYGRRPDGTDSPDGREQP